MTRKKKRSIFEYEPPAARSTVAITKELKEDMTQVCIDLGLIQTDVAEKILGNWVARAKKRVKEKKKQEYQLMMKEEKEEVIVSNQII